MIWSLENLIKNQELTNINNKWVPARPLNYIYRTFKEKIKESRGKTESFRWPEGQ